MIRWSTLLAFCAPLCIGLPAASAQHIDINLVIEDGRIATGLLDFDMISEETPCPIVEDSARIYSARLDDGAIPHFENFPGFNACPGTFTPGVRIGFDIVDALRVWDGEDFDEIPENETMFVSSGGGQPVFVETPPQADAIAQGFNIALIPEAGSLHVHVQYILTSAIGSPEPGVYMLSVHLRSDDDTLDTSEPVYLIFADGVSDQELQEAVAYIESTIDDVITLCSADFDGDFDVDLTDFGAFGSAFGTQAGDSAYDERMDLDDDGDVDLTDFGSFGAQFNQTSDDCAP